MQHRDMFAVKMIMQLGNGQDTNLYYDNRHPYEPLCYRYSSGL